MKKIIVFGATGRTGREILKQALDKGYGVTAAVRDPSALDVKHPHLRIIRVDMLQPGDLEKEMMGNHAVISALGTGNGKPTRIYSAGIAHIMVAMKSAGISRIICISAAALYLHDGMGIAARIITRLVLQPLLKKPFADMRLMESELKRSALDWTVVRPPRLTNKALTGRYRSAFGTHISKPSSISRADLAHCLLNLIDEKRVFRRIVEVSY